jgi:hypothetical protein
MVDFSPAVVESQRGAQVPHRGRVGTATLRHYRGTNSAHVEDIGSHALQRRATHPGQQAS